MDDLARVRATSHPLTRAVLASSLLADYEDRMHQLAVLRREAIRAALARGVARTEVARALNLSKGRITQILKEP